MADRIGQLLGNYRLIHLLGKGAFAEVYLGKHRYLNSEAALKILRISLDDEGANRFLFEAQMLVRLKHPHIVRVLEFSVEQGTPVLVMEHAAGGMLRKKHPRGTQLSLTQILAYVQQLADALQYAHNNHIIHRDVKPENILLDEKGNILLSDFGLALLLTSSSNLLSTQEMAGTIPYMAPEQIGGKPSFASDQYALGVITYEWLGGKRPFEGNYWEISYQHLNVAPPPLRLSRPDLPASVESVVLRALAKNPQQRFVSVHAFALALEHAIRESLPSANDDAERTLPLAGGTRPSSSAPTQPEHASPPTPIPPQPVFLSAAPADEAFAVRLKADLSKQGIRFTNELSQASTAQKTEDAARQAIRAAHVVLVVISPQMRASHIVKEHLHLASMYQRRIVFVWATGERLAQELLSLWGKTRPIDVIDARQGRYPTALDEIVDCLEEVTAISTLVRLARLGMSGEPRNPYKGLRPFTGTDALDFFGRDKLIMQLTTSVSNMLSDERPDALTARMLTVVGPSGSGKSSVVMAGLLPRLQQGALSGSNRWLYLDPIVPGIRPVEALANALYAHMPNRTLRGIREDLEDDSARMLHLLGTHLIGQSGSRIVLLIDQFEEVFTRPIPEQERRHFLDLLVTAATEPGGPFIVLLTLRADFYDRPMHYPELSSLIEASHISVLPMDIHDLRAVVERPAEQPDVQLTFEGNLVGDLLFETIGQAGALPLLEFTLDQLFQRRDGHKLTIEAYERIGGVKGALANHAEATYKVLPSDEHRDLARVLFLRLINPGANEQDTTRRRASLAELTMPDPKHTAIICSVADAFIAARLLTTNEVAGEPTVEVSHEALIREWHRLVRWLHEARGDLALHRTLGADVADWLRRNRPTDRLYHDTKLAEAQAWAERSRPNADEVAFIRASASEQQRQEGEKEQQQLTQLALQRRVINRQRLLVGALSLFLLIVTVLASVIEVGREQVDAQRQQAASRAFAGQAYQALTQNQVARALLLGVKANQTDDTYDARDNLFTILERNPHLATILKTDTAVDYETFHPDNQIFVSLSTTGAMTIWNTQTRKGHTLYMDVPPGGSLIQDWTLSPDERIAAGASNQGLWLWNTATGARIMQLETATNGSNSGVYDETPLAFSLDGTLLASGRCKQYQASQCTQGRILLWNIAAQKPTSRFLFSGNALVTQLAFTPDGKTLISSTKTLDTTGTNGGIQSWDVASGTQISSAFTGFTGKVDHFALSPDGKTLAASDSSGTLSWWDVATQKALLSSRNVKNIQCLAISPDNKQLAVGGSDKTIQVWNVVAQTPVDSPLTLPGHQDSIKSLTFSPDSKMLVSGDASGGILLWNMTAQSPVKQPFSYSNRVTSAIFSPDGRTIVAGDSTGQITLRDIDTDRIVGTLDATLGPVINDQQSLEEPLAVKSLTFSPDKHILAAGRYDGQIFLWNASTGQLITHFRQEKGLITLAFHGPVLAASYENGTILLWNAASGQVLHKLVQHPLGGIPTPNTIVFSPNGKTLASGDGNTVVFWDTDTGKPTGRLTGHQDAITGVAYSSDGSTLASIDNSSTILLWNVQTMKILDEPIKNVDPEIAEQEIQHGLAFSPDGTLLAAGGDQSVTVWDLKKHERFTHALRTVSPGLITEVGGVAFHADGQRLLTITDAYPVDHYVTVWNLKTSSWENAACSIANRNLTQDEWARFVGSNTPHQKVCPHLPLDDTVIAAELVQAHTDVVEGHAQDARAIYAQATHEAAQLDNPAISNNICWAGSTHQFANIVLPACEQATTLNPYNGFFRDSRGLARALTGNRQGAIEDFTYFVQWEQTAPNQSPGSPVPQELAQRRAWIQQLKAGQNPFDPTTLKKLQGTDQLGK